jgi:hypothetical protein
LKYLKDQLFGTEYFSEEAMRRRAPQLYEELVGQYKPPPDPWDDSMPLSERILHNMDEVEMLADQAATRGVGRAGTRGQQQMMVEEEEDDEDEEEEEEEEEGEGEDQADNDAEYEGGGQDQGRAPNQVQVDAETRKLKYEEFVDLMKRNFISGKDHKYFDYRAVDENPEFDDTDQLNRDLQDRYFQDDDDDD